MEIRELARFVNVTKPWIASSDMSEEMVSALKEALLGLTDATALKSIKKQGFLPAEDNDYGAIREAMKKNDEFFQRKDDN